METNCCAAGTVPILYSDGAIIVCVKPVGVDSERGMPSLLEAHFGGRALCVHRLDRAVGGVMVYARSGDSAAALGKAIAAGQMRKTYLAVCEGTPEEGCGTLRDLLYHDAARNKSYVVSRMRRGVREALLRYAALETRDALTLLRVELETGRSHQIRVQFASRGLPLYGDGRYGAKSRGAVALWSAFLAFPHPHTGASLRFSAPPPAAPPWGFFRKELTDDTEFQVVTQL